jgi:hypothetical protein
MGKITLVLSTTILLCLSLAWPALSDDLTEDTTDTPIFSFSGEAHLGIATSKSDTDSDVAGSLRLQLHLEPVKDISMIGRATIVEVFKTDYTDDDYYLIDRLFLSWNNIADSSFSLLAGRLPRHGRCP